VVEFKCGGVGDMYGSFEGMTERGSTLNESLDEGMANGTVSSAEKLDGRFEVDGGKAGISDY
jgi:hypothetical protein